MRTVLLLAVALLAALAPGVAHAAPPEPVPLDEGWEVADAATGPWEEVSVPHVLDPEPAEERWAGRTAVYRLRFTAPGTAPGNGWAVRFEGVRRRARVTLNGRLLGASDDPHTPFELPASSLVPGEENELVVEVDGRRIPGLREGWWTWSGITRPVSLVPLGRVALRDAALLSRVDCDAAACRAAVEVDGWLESRLPVPARPLVDVRLAPPGGEGTGRALTRTVRLRVVQPGEVARVRFSLPVPDPELWDPERPALYTGTVDARLDGSEVESTHEQRVGLKSVDVRDGVLWLNGRRLDVRGASIQEDVAGRGPALTEQDVDDIVTDLQEVNANTTRAHYLLDERLLDRFDEEGILVWNEAPVYHRDVQLRTPEGRVRELGVLRRTVLGARGHASVITHSVANELRVDVEEGSRAWLEEAAALTRELDPTLPVALDVLSWPGLARQPSYDLFDLLGINSYYGWYEGRPGRVTGDLADLAPFLRETRARYPRPALVMTEFGAEATMDGPATTKETFAFQADYLRANLEIVARQPFMSGAVYWTLREFAVKPDWDGGAERVGVERDAIHNKGLIAYDGTRKPAWGVAERAFAATPLFRTPAPGTVPAALRDDGSGAWRVLAALALLVALVALGRLLLRAFDDVWRHGAQSRKVPAGST